jgi:MinD-like ATPase involved in chromosome partitioning or flagellar assembly
MSEGSSNRAPKTLADVSHLFFSGAAPRGETRSDTHAVQDSAAVVDDSEVQRVDRTEAAHVTRIFVVTGGEASPGKSTVAVNVAQALLTHGSVGLYDADPRIPNARFYLGLPSWHYLSPLTGDGTRVPNVLTDSGLVVVDGPLEIRSAADDDGGSFGVSVDLPDGGEYALDYAVVDAPLRTAPCMFNGRSPRIHFIVVSGPGRGGFVEAYAALARLRREGGARSAGLVVNRAPSTSYARAFYAKMRLAAQRLLSMDLRFLGGVVREPAMGALQRERGVMVRSRPDATSALLLREIASNALTLRGAEAPFAGGPE